MAYDPENNPYIPGDPASYDLSWVVERLNEHKFAEESAAEAKASADAAAASALEASGYADDAEGYKNAASGFADDAAGSADEAANYAAHIADPVSGLVTSWLADNITQPTTPVVDASLSISGAAADAKVTGDIFRETIEKSPNMLWFTNQTDTTVHGVTVNFLSPDTIKLNGTATGNLNFMTMGNTSQNGTNFPAGTYYVKFEIVSGIYAGTVSYRWGSSYASWANGVHTSTQASALMVRAASGGTWTDCVLRFWVTPGSDITTYQPYGRTSAIDYIAREDIGFMKKEVREVEKNYSYLKFFAHRGCTDNAVENTIKAISDAYVKGFKGVEIDIRCTSDNIPVLSHEATVTDINGISHTISSTTWSALSALNFSSGGISYKIPSLIEALKVLRMYGMYAQLDIKQSSSAPPRYIANTVCSMDMEQYVFYGIGHDGYESVRLSGVIGGSTGKVCNIETAYVDNTTPDTYRGVLKNGRVLFGVNRNSFENLITEAEMQNLMTQGFEFYYVAETTSEMNYLLQFGPDKMETKISNLNPTTVVQNYIASL